MEEPGKDIGLVHIIEMLLDQAFIRGPGRPKTTSCPPISRVVSIFKGQMPKMDSPKLLLRTEEFHFYGLVKEVFPEIRVGNAD